MVPSSVKNKSVFWYNLYAFRYAINYEWSRMEKINFMGQPEIYIDGAKVEN